MNHSILASLLLVLAALGCRDAPLSVNVDSNMPPVAHAGDMQMVAYSGSPVTVTLDGSGSTDADGKVVSYSWFNGDDAPDGGPGRGEPDPADVMKPAVTLGLGIWTFTLFVYDDAGTISQPSSVTITVGNAVAPEVSECADNALQTIAEDCRLCVCGLSEMCRMAIAGCNQACWDFYGCVQNKCGEFVEGDMMALADCVRSNCSAFFGGVGGYMPLEPCVNRGPCAETCSESVAAP